MRKFKLNIFLTTILLAFFAISPAVMAQNSQGDKTNSMEGDIFASLNTNSDNYIDSGEFASALDDSNYYNMWDTNNDGVISKSEWMAGTETYLAGYSSGDYSNFNAWDENNDGVIKEDEFDSGLFDFVDQDSDDIIENNEFIDWFDGTFSSWDTNSDNYLESDEFTSGLNNTDYFDMWDTNNNGVISKSEWMDGAETYLASYYSGAYDDFNVWDENNDGVIKEDEFDSGLFDFVDRDSNDTVENDEFVNWLFGWWPTYG